MLFFRFQLVLKKIFVSGKKYENRAGWSLQSQAGWLQGNIVISLKNFENIFFPLKFHFLHYLGIMVTFFRCLGWDGGEKLGNSDFFNNY